MQQQQQQQLQLDGIRCSYATAPPQHATAAAGPSLAAA